MTRCVCMSSSICHILLTPCSQMTLVWPGAFSLPKALYYINRYMTIAILILRTTVSSMSLEWIPSIEARTVTAGFRPPLSVHVSSLRSVSSAPGAEIFQLFVSALHRPAFLGAHRDSSCQTFGYVTGICFAVRLRSSNR
jgi:hypothetical protein